MSKQQTQTMQFYTVQKQRDTASPHNENFKTNPNCLDLIGQIMKKKNNAPN
jgi:hypothetical protein